MTERDVNIGISPRDTSTTNVLDVTVVSAVSNLTREVDALREEVKRTRRIDELILGQEVTVDEDD